MKSLHKITLFLFLLMLPILLQAADPQIKVIEQEEDLPEKFCSIWKEGDFLISDGEFLAIIGNSHRTLPSHLNFPAAGTLGSIISFVPAGKNLKSDLIIGAPYLKIEDRRKFINYKSVSRKKTKSSDKSFTFQAEAFFEGENGQKGEIQTKYRFIPQEGRVKISSSIKNTGSVGFKDMDYSLYFNANQRYYFTPFHKDKHPSLNFRVYPKKGHSLSWVNLTPLKEEDEEHHPGSLSPGETFTVHYVLFVSDKDKEILKKSYAASNTKAEEVSILFKDMKGNLAEIIIRDAVSSSVFFRTFLKNPHSYDILLPQGVYKINANFFPAVSEKLFSVKPGQDNICTLYDPPKGKIRVKIQNSQGEHVPGKVTFIGLDPTKSPYFKPENPVTTGRYWEKAKNSCYPPEEGLEVEVATGTYLIYASRGPEYTLDQKVVEILAEDTKYEKRELVFRVDKVIQTPNLISIDPHMHTQHSDGDVKIPERLRSVAAEGLDVAIATDHNYINDYLPSLKKLGLDKYLAVISGNEITTKHVIHYNSYPLMQRKEEKRNGAIDPFFDEVTPLYSQSREKSPEAIIQVNHPRSGDIGYFNNYALDQESASFARKEFNTSFDVIEVMNGPHFYSSNYVVIKDWLHLLNRGYYFPIVGSSDSHGIAKEEPGYSRTYVYYSGQKAESLDLNALIQNIKKGRSFVSSGPIVEFKVNEEYTSGDTFTSADGKTNIWIKVQSAPWVSVDEVRVIINGERTITLKIPEKSEGAVKYEDSIGLNLKQDSYIAVEVLGKNSLFPVLQERSNTGHPVNATLPYALTNPVFVDVDGNGKFDPPLKEKIELRDISRPKNMIQRY